MTRFSLDQGAMLVSGKPLGAKGDGLIEPDALSNDAGFTDDHTGPMIDKEVTADVGSWVNVDAGGRMRDVRDQASNQRRVQAVQSMGDTMVDDGGHARIAEQNL